MIQVDFMDPVSGKGITDTFQNSELAVYFIHAQLVLWALRKNQFPAAGFDMKIREVA